MLFTLSQLADDRPIGTPRHHGNPASPAALEERLRALDTRITAARELQALENERAQIAAQLREAQSPGHL